MQSGAHVRGTRLLEGGRMAREKKADQAENRKLAKSERTKQALAEALEQLMREMPLAKVTVRAVTTRAGVDRQTFYYHFDTMNDLLEYLCRKRLPMLTENTLVSALETEDVHDLFVYVANQVYAVRETLVPLLNNSGRRLLRGIFYDTLHAALLSHMRARVDAAGVFVASSEVESAALYCQYASVLIVMDWLCGYDGADPAAKPEEIADMLSLQLDLHTKGLLANAAGK